MTGPLELCTLPTVYPFPVPADRPRSSILTVENLCTLCRIRLTVCTVCTMLTVAVKRHSHRAKESTREAAHQHRQANDLLRRHEQGARRTRPARSPGPAGLDRVRSRPVRP